MAVIQYTGIVNQIRGKLNGSVFNKARNVNTLQRKQQVARGVSGVSYRPRAVFSAIQRRWKGLTNAQRSDWALSAQNNPARDRFGDLVVLSGYNQFIRANINLFGTGDYPLDSPDTTPAPSFAWDVLNWVSINYVVLPAGGLQIQVRIQQDTSAALGVFIGVVYLGTPVSAGVTRYYGTFRRLNDWSIGPAPVEALYFGNFSRLNSEPQSGQVVWARLDVIAVATGVVVSSDFHQFVF